ncbi:hypothetical protein Desru_2226 [Desulforamulus ruminis DSM 2154]|uniref:Uncharacterized protein n=1 Tax=Desulforamulus ruminis (strain ATCC 23193 / DSM 2154 / NCIMB 8452 / DL) TaxID=696281 RepID=F6DLC7_DESRL|nr:hypothetical protein Desru_2226 [Desulforamulus ruminis DSM 2154]
MIFNIKILSYYTDPEPVSIIHSIKYKYLFYL